MNNATRALLARTILMRAALGQLLLAYAKGERCGHVEWEDVDIAVDLAKDAMQGEYERILAELIAQDKLRGRK